MKLSLQSLKFRRLLLSCTQLDSMLSSYCSCSQEADLYSRHHFLRAENIDALLCSRSWDCTSYCIVKPGVGNENQPLHLPCPTIKASLSCRLKWNTETLLLIGTSEMSSISTESAQHFADLQYTGSLNLCLHSLVFCGSCDH